VSGCVLPCVALRDRPDVKALPALGIALTLLGASLVLLPVWGLAGPNKASETPYWLTTLCVLGLAAAVAGICALLWIIDYCRDFRRWRPVEDAPSRDYLAEESGTRSNKSSSARSNHFTMR
jgi:hypothetical protein